MSVIKSKEELERRNRARKKRREQKETSQETFGDVYEEGVIGVADYDYPER